ncbi:mucoidy inhibitor MuiA family protein [Candidatus Lokiarchaeum ossiferum]|uniref:mucoidy inhibitor MuiA family protein n=1 Tax=Candidatus Lokiarchaeum ossiferum TaxID=2951803 RepID=UPI00352F5B68
MAVTLETKIKHVSVYQSGARLTHIGELELKPGKNTLVIKKLTKRLDKESVRVKGTGHGQIINVNIERHTQKESKLPELNEIRKKTDQLQRELHYTQDNLKMLEERYQNHIDFSKIFFKRAPTYFNKNEINLEKISAMEQHIEKKDELYLSKRHEYESKLEKLNDELHELQKEANNIGTAQKIEEFYEISINLEVLQEGKFEIEVQFQIPDAYWIPFYDVNLSEKNAHLKLLGNVFNNSGEDWKEVQLEISSANLRPVRIIKPRPMIVKELQPLPPPRPVSASLKKRGKMKAMSGNIMKGGMDMEESIGFAAEAEPLARSVPRMQQRMAKIDESLGVQSYQLPTPLNIPSDRHPHPVTLVETILDTEKGYFWSIAAPDMIIIKDTITNGDLLLLPGNAKVYYEGEFIGESQIPLIAPKESLELGTRRTYDLKVIKRLKNRSSNKEGILKGKIGKAYQYEIEISVLKPNKYKLKLMDRMVHSDSEKIKVGKSNFNIEPESKDLGILTWNLDLTGKEKIVISYDYEVIWEKEIRITPALP